VRLLWALVAVLVVGVSPAHGASGTTLADLEDEVMCPICGTLLELSDSPQAERQRAFIARLLASGAGKEEVKDALVAEYGREVLATPEGAGFDLSAYLIPIAAFAIAAIALALSVRRWRRSADRDAGRAARTAGPPAEDAERLDADLARYDL
jgi:cytochrome c-type biogenesis protein CcmH